jgi:uroporphyrinogen-III synthase
MSLSILVIRPEPGCSATVDAGRALGLDLHGYPLFAVHPCRWTAPDPDTVDAVLIGSVNAIRLGGEQLARFLGKPVYAVGETSADAARQGGFTVAGVGKGGLQSVVADLASPIRLLRLAGEDRVPLFLPPGISMETCVIYSLEPLPMPAPMAEVVGKGGLVLLHSASAARHFASEVDRLAVPRERISVAALGPRIVSAVGEGWYDARSALEPTDAALLVLAAEMCQVTSRRKGH